LSKKVLITGGAGFIGLHLSNFLLNKGYKVDIVDNFARGMDDEELQEVLAKKNSSFFNIDLLDNNMTDKLGDDYSLIFHLGAIIGVSRVLEQPYNVLYDNIRMLGNIIDLARKQSNLSRLFFASTSEVYAGSLKYFDLEIPTPESSPLTITDLSHSRTSYMLSKIYGEALCQKADIPFTLFRPHNIYGPRMGMAHVVPEQLKKAHEANDGDKIEVFSANHTRCFCYIDDAVEMLWRMAERHECRNQTLNLGTQEPEIKIKEVAETCFYVTNKKLKIKEMPASPGSPARRGPDMSETKKLINYESKVSFLDGVSRTYKWYKKNIFDGGRVSAK